MYIVMICEHLKNLDSFKAFLNEKAGGKKEPHHAKTTVGKRNYFYFTGCGMLLHELPVVTKYDNLLSFHES